MDYARKGSTTAAEIKPSPPSTMAYEADVPNRYAMLENQGSVRPPPPYRRNIPRYHSHHHRSKGSRCLRCFCCCICCLLFFIVLLVAAFAALYYFFNPQMPTYDVDKFDVKAFGIRNDNKIYAEIAVVVKAENPNGDIGFDYGKNSAVSIIYSGSQVCSGQIPSFFQPGKNTTRVNVVLKGQNDFGPQMQHDLMQNQKTGNIPLLIKVKIPVTVLLHGNRLREFVVNVNCSMVIDNLQPSREAKILKKDFTYKIQL